jgi:hypothetical protein
MPAELLCDIFYMAVDRSSWRSRTLAGCNMFVSCTLLVWATRERRGVDVEKDGGLNIWFEERFITSADGVVTVAA